MQCTPARIYAGLTSTSTFITAPVEFPASHPLCKTRNTARFPEVSSPTPIRPHISTISPPTPTTISLDAFAHESIPPQESHQPLPSISSTRTFLDGFHSSVTTTIRALPLHPSLRQQLHHFVNLLFLSLPTPLALLHQLRPRNGARNIDYEDLRTSDGLRLPTPPSISFLDGTSPFPPRRRLPFRVPQLPVVHCVLNVTPRPPKRPIPVNPPPSPSPRFFRGRRTPTPHFPPPSDSAFFPHFDLNPESLAASPSSTPVSSPVTSATRFCQRLRPTSCAHHSLPHARSLRNCFIINSFRPHQLTAIGTRKRSTVVNPHPCSPATLAIPVCTRCRRLRQHPQKIKINQAIVDSRSGMNEGGHIALCVFAAGGGRDHVSWVDEGRGRQ
ncbi:hypothetical protein R3P38DRAFT_3519285 [Favolaschia claudopus]|uniref:Uncharacterized protein n=1 Tax=Favolaschia claudopus TaxID=2862362 RepID=A0AAW0BTV5_9AGAR